jgi:hypothetical protein
MAAPTYLTPSYISYDMIKGLLSGVKVSATPILDPAVGGGIYAGDIDTLIADAEADVITNILSNYLALPLQGENGETFDALYNNLSTRALSYIPIRALFTNCAIYFIYRTYFAYGGNTNGQALTENALAKYNADKVAYSKLDNVTNPALKNVFKGMKLVDNFSSRIPHGCIVPDIPGGDPQSSLAINSTPDFFNGFNR